MKDMDSIRRKLEGVLSSRSEEDDQSSAGGERSDQSPSSPSRSGAPPTSRSQSDRYVLGRSPRTGEKVSVPANIGKHSLVLGTSGTGKSTFLLSQMLQDVRRGHSVFLIDPHGGVEGLSHKFLSHIPESREDDVVYINPMTAISSHEQLVKINFLQPKRMKDDLVREMFIDALKRTYPEFWGPRLENILTHALMLLFDTEDIPTIEQLTRVVPNRGNARWERIKECTEDEVVQFWRKDFRDMDPQSYTSVMNKIYKMMTASPMRPFSRAKESSVDLYEQMNEGGIVVVEIPKGRMTENISAFFGSIFLARLAQLAMQRDDIPEDERRPVHVYADEAHTFVTDIIQRNMQELRKFGVLLTACSQNLQRYSDAGNENILPELADYTVSFRCGEDTARRIGEKFASRLGRDRYTDPWEPLTKLRDFEFYAAVPIGTSIEIKKAKTIDVGMGERSRNEIVERSLENYGDETKARKKVEGKGDVTIGSPHLAPSRFFVLHYLDKNNWDREDNIVDHLKNFRGIRGEDAKDAVDWLAGEYVQKDTNLPWDKSKEAEKRNEFMYLRKKGKEALYPVIEDVRAGGVKHISMMCQVMRNFRSNVNEMIAPVLPGVNLAGEAKAVITEVETEEGEKIYPDLMAYYAHPGGWFSNDVAAVEVDTNPKKKEFLKHYKDNRDRIETPTLIAVKDKGEVDFVRSELEKEGAKVVNELNAKSEPNEVEIRVVDPENIEHPSEVDAERDTDKRLYRQVMRSCVVNGKTEEYKEFVGYEDDLTVGEPSEAQGESETEGVRAEELVNIPETLDRVEELGKEGRTKVLENEVQKLGDAGCDFNLRKRNKVKVKYEDEEGEASRVFEGEVAKQIASTMPDASSPSEEGSSPRAEGEETKGETRGETGKGSSVEPIVDRIENSVEEMPLRDLRGELGRLEKRKCSIRVTGRDRVKVSWKENGEKRSLVFTGERARKIVDAMEGKEETSAKDKKEKDEAKSTDEKGEDKEQKEKASSEAEGESEGQQVMSDQEREEWKNMTGEERWSEIERIADELKGLKEEGSPVQDLSEKLKSLRGRGCTILVQSSGKYEYLRVDKSVSGKTKNKLLGSLDEKWKEACELAGIEL